MSNEASYSVLVVEDNSPDVILINEALSEAGLNCSITQMKDGDEAMKALLEADGHSRYDLMILDLNMPRVGGLEVLSRLRAVPSWRDTPILVLTSSLSPQERDQAKDLGASEYVRKAADLYEFLSSVGQAARRLLQTA